MTEPRTPDDMVERLREAIRRHRDAQPTHEVEDKYHDIYEAAHRCDEDCAEAIADYLAAPRSIETAGLREAAQDILTSFARRPGWVLEHDSEEADALREALAPRSVETAGLDVDALARWADHTEKAARAGRLPNMATEHFMEGVRFATRRIAALAAPRSVETPRAIPPEGTRLVLVAEDLLGQFGTRTDSGYAITVEWGEQRPEGWYEPTFTVHYDQPLAALSPDMETRMVGGTSGTNPPPSPPQDRG